MQKGLTRNKTNGHFYWQFVYKDPVSGRKKRYHFVAKIKDKNGVIRFAENEEEAILARAQFITNGGKIDEPVINLGRITIYELITMYKDYCISINKRHSTIINYCLYFLEFLADYYYKGNVEKAKEIFIDEIGTIDISRYRQKRQKDYVMIRYKTGKKSSGRKIKNSAINREVNSIQGMFTYAVGILKKLKENPCTGLSPLPVVKVIKTPLSEEQEAFIFQEVKQKDYVLYVMILMFETFGNRKKEVYTLQWKNLSLKSNNIFRYGYVDFLERKNGKSIRLPLSEDLRDCLLKLPKLSEYVFTNPKTLTCYKNRKKVIDNLLIKVGAKQRGVGHHIFRHSTATFSENSGATASEVRDLLGQTDVNSLDTYLNQGSKRLQEIINRNAERIRKNENKQKNNQNAQEMPKNKIKLRCFKLIRNLKSNDMRA